MTDPQATVVESVTFFALLFVLALVVIIAWRWFLKQGDVIAEANEIRADHQSIESFVEEWMPLSQKVAIAEARYLDKERTR